ncbi:lysophospholipid acyltransferase family protein [Rhodovulum sp. DZ06]|uniref:lysophospholipid acyltransferase family protein n=1 Tax=Rhodovulum sp. DZ06 TaxID=3425126 RepID=UPI003D350B2D
MTRRSLRMGGVAREITYETGVQTRAGRLMVRGFETLSGRRRLVDLAAGYEDEVAAGADFWEVIARRYGIGLNLPGQGLANIPAQGGALVVANHPFGILDGLMLGRILSAARPDGFRIVANQVFNKAEEVARVVLPISFDGDKAARGINVATRRAALDHLAAGGIVGIFPGGTVSTARRPFGPALDPPWKTFTARLAAKSGVPVIPVYFDGANSRRFQVASHLHYTLRLALLIHEFRTRVGREVTAVIGAPIPPETIAAKARDGAALMDFLRAQTYALSPRPLKDMGYGFDYDLAGLPARLTGAHGAGAEAGRRGL